MLGRKFTKNRWITSTSNISQNLEGVWDVQERDGHHAVHTDQRRNPSKDDDEGDPIYFVQDPSFYANESTL